MALFSVVIPVYNVEAWIDRCLGSILSDRCDDVELILVDDGSMDQSGVICDRYAASYRNVSVIHKENGGLSSARNAGLEKASGTWISFIDSDDWVNEDSFATVASFLAQLDSEPDIVKFGYKKVGGGRDQVFVPCVPEGAYGRDRIIGELLPAAFGGGRISDSTIHTFVLSACAHIYRRDFLMETGVRFTSERKVGSEDFLFLDSLYLRASCVYVTHLAWYNYDTREGSLTQRYRRDLWAQYRLLGSAVHGELRSAELDSLLADDYKVFYIGLMYICVMNECVAPGGRLAQLARVRAILRDRGLKESLRGLRFSDYKSRILASCMRAGLGLPLCAIQWRKARK